MAINLSIFNTAIDSMQDNLGYVATYTPFGGEVVEGVLVFIELETMINPQAYNSATWSPQTTIEVALSDIDNVEPNKHDTFAIDSSIYEVSEVLENDNWFAKLAVFKV